VIHGIILLSFRMWDNSTTPSKLHPDSSGLVLPRCYALGIVRLASFSAHRFLSWGLIISESH